MARGRANPCPVCTSVAQLEAPRSCDSTVLWSPTDVTEPSEQRKCWMHRSRAVLKAASELATNLPSSDSATDACQAQEAPAGRAPMRSRCAPTNQPVQILRAHPQTCARTAQMEVKHACEAYFFDYNERAIAMNDRISAERLWPQHSVERIADPVNSLAIEHEPAPYQTNNSACGFTQQALACNFNATTVNKAPEWENC